MSISTSRYCPVLPVLPANAALDSFTQVEGASGSTHNDVIRGSDVTAADMPTEGFRGSALDAEGIALITGLQALLAGAGPASFDAQGRFVGGNILLGGDGSDLIEGRGGDDIIDGDSVAARPHRRHVDLRRQRSDGQHRACRTTTA